MIKCNKLTLTASRAVVTLAATGGNGLERRLLALAACRNVHSTGSKSRMSRINFLVLDVLQGNI